MGLLSSIGDAIKGVSPVLSGVGSVVGAVTGITNAKKNRDTQKEFAQNGVQWRVNDAKKAGIHPVYSLGYNGHSFQNVGLDGGTDYGLQGLGQSIENAVRSDEPDEDSVLFQKENNRLTLQGQELENQMKALEVQQKWRELNNMGQSPAFKGLNPFASPDSTPSPVGNGQAVSSGQVRIGYGFDEPIAGYSFIPLPDGTIKVMPSKDRVDYITEGAPFGLGAIPFYLERYYNSDAIKSHLERKYKRKIYDDNGLPFMGSYSFPRPPWYRRPIYQQGKFFWQD